MLGDDWIKVRGIPMLRLEVAWHEERLGGMLFDESVFHNEIKKKACANVIKALDRALKIYLVKKDLPDLPEEPVAIDIYDPGWLYIPVKLSGPESGIVYMPTKESPAGKVAWFRIKKGYKVASN